MRLTLSLRIFLAWGVFVGVTGYFVLRLVADEIKPAVRQSTEEALVDSANLLAELLAAEHEIVTLIEGEGSSVAETRKVVHWLEEHHDGVEAEIHHGGQPLYPYFLGIE